jgi:hypothetical protein
MNETWERILELIHKGDIRVSEHGYDELADDDITVREIVAPIQNSIVIEDYPKYLKGPCVLVLQYDKEDRPIRVVWGIPKDKLSHAVLVTAYRPDPARWTKDFQRRKG